MAAGSRPSRIGDQLRAELSELITRSVKDPGIGFLTITQVKVTPDLQVARVYYTTLGDEQARRESRLALERAGPFLRRQIGNRLRLKRVPRLEFFFDESIERGDRIERILQELGHEGASSERGESERGEEEAGGAAGARGEPAPGGLEEAHPDERQDDE